MNRDPLRQRDLPNAEAMLRSILSDAAVGSSVEELDNLDYTGRRPNRWLQGLVAAAAVAVIAGVGWGVTRPTHHEVEPGSRPTIVPSATSARPTNPTITPTQPAVPAPAPTENPVTEPAPTTRVPTAQPTTAEPVPTTPAVPTSPAAVSPTESTPPTPDPAVQPPSMTLLETRRVPSDTEGVDWVHVSYQLCSGSGRAQVVGPIAYDTSLVNVPAPADMGPRLGSGGSIGPDQCITRSDTVRAVNNPTRFDLAVEFTFEPGSPEARFDALYNVTVGA